MESWDSENLAGTELLAKRYFISERSFLRSYCSVVTNRGISLPQDFQNCPGIGKNTFPGLFLEVAFVGLK